MKRVTFTINASLKSLMVAMLAIVGISVVSSLSAPQTALAWCDNVNLEFNNVCVSQNYDSLPASIKQTTTRAQYVELAESCMNGNANGFDFGIRQGGCADAAKSCLENAVDVQKVCSGDNMAQMVGGAGFEGGCNEGKLTEDNRFNPLGATCPRLVQANNSVINDKMTEAENKAKEACVANGSETEKTYAQEACARAITESCSKPQLDDNGRLKNKDDYSKYTQCLDEAYYKKAANKEECMTKRGGIWMDGPTKDPNGPNTLGAGCYKQASDLTNPQACEQGGKAAGRQFEWKQTNKAGDPTAYGCVDPQSPNGVDQQDPTAQCLKNAEGTGCADKLDGGEGKCGQAKTNIISCNGEGAGALGDVLRIGVVVLSICVGIAAVGGIAWSSVQYASATDNQSNVSSARERIRNIIIGLLLYGFMVAIINWLVPGGIIG